MNVKISGAASQDLLDGFYFYERQDSGLGAFFLDALFSDVDSLLCGSGLQEESCMDKTPT